MAVTAVGSNGFRDFMFIKQKQLRKEYDLIIIGAGPAGLVLAKEVERLSAGHASILVIESGDRFDSQNIGQAISRYQASGDLNADYFPPHNRRLVGGTSSVWSGFCAALEKRSFLTGDWPFGYQELEKYYPQAASILKLPTAVYKRPETRLGVDSELVYRPYYLSPPKRFNDSETLEWLGQSENVTILTLHTVLKINTTDDAATGVSLKSSEGNDNQPFSIGADKVVVACGGTQNPRLLQMSLLGDRELPIGRYFCEHPHVYQELELILDYDQLSGVINTKTDRIVHALSLSSDFLADNGWLSATVDITDLRRKSVNLLGRRKSAVVTKATLRAEMRSLAENRVELSGSSTDSLKQPIARVEMRFNKRDLGQSVDAISEELVRSGLGRLSRLPDEYVITGGGHMMGTTRMGADMSTSVTDRNAKVHGINNLYVIGSSLYPAVAAANPTYTIVALAIRLAGQLYNTRSEAPI